MEGGIEAPESSAPHGDAMEKRRPESWMEDEGADVERLSIQRVASVKE